MNIWDSEALLQQLESNGKGVAMGNKWWVSIEDKTRLFTVKYAQRFATDKAKTTGALENKLSRLGDTLTIELAREDPGHSSNKCC